jgi:hypothetical protein
MQTETYEQLVARVNANAFLVPEAHTAAYLGDRMKVLKKYEHKAKPKGVRQAKYDWNLILNGQHVMLESGVDYVPIGKNKANEDFDRTDVFIRTIESRADEQNKKVQIDKVEGGIVVTATDMTPEQIAARDQRRAKAKAERDAAAANGTAPKANGTVSEPVEAAAGESL